MKAMSSVIMTEKEQKVTKSKVLANDVVRVRGATGDENPPIIISVPRAILNAANLKKGDEVRIYTDGTRVYLEKLGVPVI